MNKNLTISFSILAALIAIITIAALMSSGSSSSDPDDASDPGTDASDSVPTVSAEVLVREDSCHLDEVADASVTVVEFLDFECEACGAQFPVMEQLREDYDGQINFVIRCFPLDGHRDSRPAAAAQQGALEEMYVHMFET